MAESKKGGAVKSPPRYDDVVNEDTTHEPASSLRSQGPASTLRAPLGAGDEAFDRNTREDSSRDPDRGKRRTPQSFDAISRILGLTMFSAGPSFKFCVNHAGYPVEFSRLYTDPDILIDLFSSDSVAVREEVAKKRAALIAHNADAEQIVQEARARAEDEALRLLERAEDERKRGLILHVKSLDEYVADQIAVAMTYLRRACLVPYGYLPIIGPLTEGQADIEGLRNGVVYDLPPPIETEDWQPNGLGTRVNRRIA